MNESLTTSKNGLDFISRWEGCVLNPYLDVANLWTIGVGHLILQSDSFSNITNAQIKSLLSTKDKNNPIAKISISKNEALSILSQDVKKCEDSIKKNIKVSLNQNQFDALVSFGFNCGTGVYSKSGVATVLNAGNYTEVPTRLLDWDKSRINGVLQPVLRTRRMSEGQLFARQITNTNDPIVPWTKEELKIVQQQLKKLGLYSMNVDGIWGGGTRAGIISFASSIGITLQNPVDGIPASVLNELKKK